MKKRLLTALIAMVLTLSVSACGSVDSKGESGNSQSDINSSQAIDNSSDSEDSGEANGSSDDSEVQPTGEFDWDVAMDSFYISGVKIEYPFSESSLDENFIFHDDQYYNDVGDYLDISVDYQNALNWSFTARYKGIKEGEYNSDFIVSAIPYMYEPSIQGIEIGSSMEKVYELWGEPDEILDKLQESDSDTAVYYGKEKGQQVYVSYNNISNCVTYISIDFVDMKG